jgi:hypothetical protein
MVRRKLKFLAELNWAKINNTPSNIKKELKETITVTSFALPSEYVMANKQYSKHRNKYFLLSKDILIFFSKHIEIIMPIVGANTRNVPRNETNRYDGYIAKYIQYTGMPNKIR